MDKDNRLKLIKLIAAGLVVLILIDLFVHYKSAKHRPVLPVPVVLIKKPEMKNVVEYITQTGNTVAYNSVNLVARIEGYLENITFTDGTFVKKGQPLFVIEPEPYLEKLREAQATVESKQAAYAYAKSEYERQKKMYKDNATSLNSVESWFAQSVEAKANVAQAIANEKIAAINYSYTHIEAPFNGRIGRHLIDTGNLVGNGVATTLATIDQIDPIYVYFNLNELDLIRLRAAARAQGYKARDLNKISAFVSLQNGAEFKYEGKLDFINTGLTASTGTLTFRVLLPNKNHILLPGLFVQVRFAISKPALKLTVPDAAVLYDQIGAYLLVVNQDNHVELKRVVTAGLEQGRRTILKGLDVDDRVIVGGLQNATPGNLVSPKDENKTA